jgi:DNA primase catalytic subunit
MFKWLSYSKLQDKENRAFQSLDEGTESDYFSNREFSFTLENDVYCRYLCYKTASDFHANLVDRVPFKIDIGAVYNYQPVKHLMVEK